MSMSTDSDLNQIPTLRKQIVTYVNHQFQGFLLEYRQPTPGRVAYDISGWSIKKLQTWTENMYSRHLKLQPQIQKYLEIYKKHYENEYENNFDPPWGLSAQADEDAKQEELPIHLGQIWWTSVLFANQQKLVPLLQKRENTEKQYLNNKADSDQEKDKLKKEYQGNADELFPFWSDLRGLQQWAIKIYWYTAVLEGICLNAPNVALTGQTKNGESSTQQVDEEEIDMVDGYTSILMIFRSKLLFHLCQYENTLNDKLMDNDIVVYDEGPWTRSVKQSLQNIVSTFDMWQQEVERLKSEPIKEGFIDRIYVEVDQTIAQIVNRAREVLPLYDWNSNGAGWAEKVVPILQDLRKEDLRNQPEILVNFYNTMTHSIALLSIADNSVGLSPSAPFHPWIATDLISEKSALAKWSRDQWRALSWDLFELISNLPPTVNALKKAAKKEDALIAESAANGVKASHDIWTLAGNEYWEAERFLFWARSVFLSSIVLQCCFHRAVDSAHKQRFHTQYLAAKKTATPVKIKSNDEKLDDQTELLKELYKMTKEQTAKLDNIENIGNQVIDTVINTEISKIPRCVLILPDAPALTMKDKISQYKQLIFTKSHLHLLCEFCCHEDPNDYTSKLEKKWHLTTHSGFELERLKCADFLNKAGPAIKGTLFALHMAAKVGAVIGLNATEFTGKMYDTMKSTLDDNNNAQSRLLAEEDNLDTNGNPKELHGEGLECFREIVGLTKDSDKQSLGGVHRAAIRRNGPPGKAGDWKWLCTDHEKLIKQWNDKENTMSVQEFYEQVKQIDLKQQNMVKANDNTTDSAQPQKPKDNSIANNQPSSTTTTTIVVMVEEKGAQSDKPSADNNKNDKSRESSSDNPAVISDDSDQVQVSCFCFTRKSNRIQPA